MHLVLTEGTGSMDRYSQELAQRVDVPTVRTDIYQQVAERFGVPVISRTSVRAAVADWRFVRTLRAVPGAIHLPNHHLGRYGRFLSQPYIVTVHDLIRYFDMSRQQPLIHRPNARDRFYLRLDYAGIRAADAVIAVSHATRHDLVAHLGIPDDRIHVVYEGVDHHRFHPVEARAVDYPYILYVGSEHPRKNLAALLEAFRAVKATGLFPDLKLVKLGAAGGAEAEFRRDTEQEIARVGLAADDVVLAGRVSDEALAAYYSGAICCVLPSLYEGFGLPVLEAMACGCPAIVSSASALPEIAGDAAVLASPYAVDMLTGALRSLLTDPNRRAELSRRGMAHARAFTWDRTARETADVYQQVEAEAARRRARRYRPSRLARFARTVRTGMSGSAVAWQAAVAEWRSDQP